ncbi:hypothetical protein RFI_03914, partial [Reticulomyxa filosa]
YGILCSICLSIAHDVILVKNIPFDIQIQDLQQLFSKYGQLGNILLPETKAMAIVQFLDPIDAKKAFQNLAFSKFKKLSLFLEWVPIDIFDSLTTSSIQNSNPKDSNSNSNSELKQAKNHLLVCFYFSF